MILMYHKVALADETMWWVSVDAFDRQMADLRAYDVVPLSDYDPRNPRHACITFDGVYENVHRFAFPILKKWGYPFELFVIGDHIGGDNAFDTVEPLARFCSLEQLAEMAAGGGRVQWHTRTHRRLLNLDEAALDDELLAPDALRERFPSPHLRWFAYPHGDHDDRAVARVKAHHEGALSCVAGTDEDRYQLNRVTVVESTNLSRSRVSVIIANHNYGTYLPEAVDSVLSQTRRPDEIIILDDASTDGSQTIAQRYVDVAKVVLNEQNLGIVENFRKGVSLSTSDYVAFLGADNRMRADYVERCKALLDARPEAGVVYTDMLIFGSRARALAERVGAETVGTSRAERWPLYRWRFPDPTEDVVANIASANFIHGSSMYRRAAYDAVGGYQSSAMPEDHHLFSRMLAAGWAPVRAPHALIQYRQHSYNQANTVLGLQYEVAYWRQTAQGHAARAAELEAQTAQLKADLRDLEARLGGLATETHNLVRRAGLETVIASSDLFDPEGYARRAGLSPGEVLELARHYLRVGEAKRLAPSDRFDPAFYAASNPDVVAAGMGLLEHYLQFGQFEGRRPQARAAADVATDAQGGDAEAPEEVLIAPAA